MADPASSPTVRRPDKGLPTLATELWELVVSYLKQETLEPIKGLGKFIAFGVVGALLLAIGLVMMAVAVLRTLQVETRPHWSGHLSWLPYVVTIVAVGAVALVVASRIGVERRKKGQ